MTYTIGEVAEKLHIAPSTIRYYDKLGILPFLDKNQSGIRVFKESDFEYLYIIECLKNSGMPLKTIRHYIRMCTEGDSTMNERYQMLLKQQVNVHEQMKMLDDCLSMLKYQTWYYEKAIEAGTTDVHKKRGRDATHKAYEKETGVTAPWPEHEHFTVK